MTSGVYLLTFSDGNNYVGKSINIERRWKEHGEKMEKGIAAKNMQQAFKRCGHAHAQILLKCHPDHIDIMESYYICKLRPTLNSADTVAISHRDIQLFDVNKHMLEFSTSDHIQLIADQQDRLNKLDNGYVDQLLDLNRILMQKLREANTRAKPGFWASLFS